MKTFKGRVVTAGEATLEAVVSHQGFNTLASCQKSALKKKAKEIIVADQNNKDLYGKNITGKALCLPITIGSTTGGIVIQTIAARGLAPAAMLFSEPIDSLAASGVLLANIFEKSPLICIDNLGKEFLDSVKDGDRLEISATGSVTILD